MSKVYRAYEPDQIFLLPPSVKDWLPASHLAHFVSDVVDGLELSPITSGYEKEARGYPPYHPVMMTKVLVYGYCIGVTSSRRLARAMQEDVACRMLAANNAPDFRTVAEFRRRHLAALRGLFLQVLQLCAKAGLIKLAHVALDGTKIKANASRDRSLSYSEMQKQERELQAKIDRYFEEAEEADAKEDEKFGADKRGDELPEELRDPERRLRKIRELKEELEREARQAAENRKEKIEERRASGPKGGRPSKELAPEPKATRQRNLTDHDSRLMPSKGAFVQGYNCQAAVDAHGQVIVAVEVEQGSTDAPYAGPMIKQVADNLGQAPKIASMDAGYSSRDAVAAVEALGCEAFIPPDDRWSSKSRSFTEVMRRRLSSRRGRRIYAQRKCIVEPVFGQIKAGRGFRQFLLRGIEKVRSEWSLICTGHNLLKLWRRQTFAYATG